MQLLVLKTVQPWAKECTTSTTKVSKEMGPPYYGLAEVISANNMSDE